jgi:N-acetylglucosaminyldiphosphoundecaprenol N-acetyl-beta-D-mannosaminyltransferase
MESLQSIKCHDGMQLGHDRHWASYDILGVRFDLISYTDVMTTVEHWRERGLRCYVTLTPPHSVLMCLRDPQLREATGKASMTLPDGVGIILAAGLLRVPHEGRVTGPTLMLRLCDWGRKEGFRHFFYGGLPGVAETLAEKLCARFPGLHVAGTYSPPFRELTVGENAHIIHHMNGSKPDVIWVGLGSPKQEKWMASHVGEVNAAVMIGVGAAFDFHSGRVKWAPAWMRRAGLEWAHRLASNPKQMWRRNMDSVLFLTKVCRQSLYQGTPTRKTSDSADMTDQRDPLLRRQVQQSSTLETGRGPSIEEKRAEGKTSSHGDTLVHRR